MLEPVPAVRVLTWNLWWRFGDWRRRFDAMASVLRAADPDICCFQEVWSTATADCAAELGKAIGLQHVVRTFAPDPSPWQQQLGLLAAEGVQYGNAIVSRWPFSAAMARLLPGGFGRTALAVMISCPMAEIPVICTHLAAHPDESATRCEQVRAIIGVTGALAGVARSADQRKFPPLIAGDLNAGANSAEVRLLSGIGLAPTADGPVFLDAWRHSSDPDRGWTWQSGNPYVTAMNMPSARIDYIHIAQTGPGGLGRVLDIRIAGDGPVAGIWPSDHSALVADLALVPMND